MSSFKDLIAWRRCHALAIDVYATSENFPKREWYGLTAQTRRAAVSAAVNIAEGSAKRGAREFRRYIDIALGSLAEVEALLLLARDLGYLTGDAWQSLESARRRAGYLTWRLYQSPARNIGKAAR